MGNPFRGRKLTTANFTTLPIEDLVDWISNELKARIVINESVPIQTLRHRRNDAPPVVVRRLQRGKRARNTIRPRRRVDRQLEFDSTVESVLFLGTMYGLVWYTAG